MNVNISVKKTINENFNFLNVFQNCHKDPRSIEDGQSLMMIDSHCHIILNHHHQSNVQWLPQGEKISSLTLLP